jgi:hypothetical protein
MGAVFLILLPLLWERDSLAPPRRSTRRSMLGYDARRIPSAEYLAVGRTLLAAKWQNAVYAKFAEFLFETVRKGVLRE